MVQLSTLYKQRQGETSLGIKTYLCNNLCFHSGSAQKWQSTSSNDCCRGFKTKQYILTTVCHSRKHNILFFSRLIINALCLIIDVVFRQCLSRCHTKESIQELSSKNTFQLMAPKSPKHIFQEFSKLNLFASGLWDYRH